MTQYLVVKLTPCPCGGRLYTLPLRDGETDSIVYTSEGYCPLCGGTGWQRTEVPLEEALREVLVEVFTAVAYSSADFSYDLRNSFRAALCQLGVKIK